MHQILTEAVKFGAQETGKRVVFLGLHAKDVIIGAGLGIASFVGGKKLLNTGSQKLHKRNKQIHEKADEIVNEAMKELEDKK